MLLAMGVVVPLALSHADKDMNVTHPLFPWVAACVWTSMFLLLLGLPGLYARQAEECGRLGLLAFVIAFAGTLLVGGISWFGNFVAPVLGEVIPDTIREWDRHPPPRMAAGVGLTFGLFSIGWMLFGVVTARARVLPKGAGVVLAAGGAANIVLAFMDVPVGFFLIGLGALWLGLAAARQWAAHLDGSGG